MTTVKVLLALALCAGLANATTEPCDAPEGFMGTSSWGDDSVTIFRYPGGDKVHYDGKLYFYLFPGNFQSACGEMLSFHDSDDDDDADTMTHSGPYGSTTWPRGSV